jgi:hypothetical protein
MHRQTAGTASAVATNLESKMPYVQLPQNHVPATFEHLYFPHFGQIQNCRVATVGINCGTSEGRYDRCGLRLAGFDVGMTSAQAYAAVPELDSSPNGYFGTLANLYGFWSHFTCGGEPAANPLHRDFYANGLLAHVDVTPWATRVRWSDVPTGTRADLLALGQPVLAATLAGAPASEVLGRPRK